MEIVFRQLSPEEIRHEFLEYLWLLIDDEVKNCQEDPARLQDLRRCFSRLIHSTLTALDGMSGGLTGGFHLIPTCHATDPDYHRETGKNWWPSNEDLDLEARSGISDVILNDEFYDHDPKKMLF